MSRLRIALAAAAAVLVLLAVAIATHAQTPRPDPAPACRLYGAGAFTAPENSCTPGRWVIPGATEARRRAFVCTPKPRPGLPVSERRRLLREYGVPDWTGRSGEIDHRVPVFLGGLTVEDNLWPQRGSIPNRKDALENLVRWRICVDHTMRVRTAVRLFLANWIHAYQALVVKATT